MFSYKIIEPLQKLLLIKGVKSPRKKVCFSANFALLAEFFVLVLISSSVERCFVSRMQHFFLQSGKTNVGGSVINGATASSLYP